MYRIVKRIVHTITTVTWLIRLEDNTAEEKYLEKEISFPASHSVTEEDLVDTVNAPEEISKTTQPILDEGEKP